MITVFTPTYNRGKLLNRLYQSLRQQTHADFEWIIIDDGSSDDTASIVERLQNNHEKTSFPILYFKKENGGKHTAINMGVEKAQGELFFIADSDDTLPPAALQFVAEVWDPIKKDVSFGGVCGFDGNMNGGRLIGSGFPDGISFSTFRLSDDRCVDYIDGTTRQVRFNLGVDGDMKEVFRTSVLREYPFPKIDEERFCPEVLVWNRIAARYKMRHINQIIYWVEYQQDGISASITQSRMSSPVATTMTYAEMLDDDVALKWKIRSAVNYWRFKYCADKKSHGIPKIKWYWKLWQPAGLVMHLKDRRTAR